MSRIILVHGAWCGSWAWEKLLPQLERAGHHVQAPDLPGHGGDSTPIREVSLEGYTDRITQVLDAEPEPAVLVGHSLGGAVISQAAEQRPDKTNTLVYMAAFLLRDGETVRSVLANDTESLLMPAMVTSEDETYFTLREDTIVEAWCADCSAGDRERVKSQAGRQATAPGATPVVVTEGNFGRVPRVYVETLRDRTITPSAQRGMYGRTPCEKVILMDTGHFPQYAAPEELTDKFTSVVG